MKNGEKSLLIKSLVLRKYPPIKIKKFLNSLTGKFAAKEAIAKALGNGFKGGLTFKSIKIIKSLSGSQKLLLFKTTMMK